MSAPIMGERERLLALRDELVRQLNSAERCGALLKETRGLFSAIQRVERQLANLPL